MLEDELIEAARLRRAARTVFDTQRALVRADLDAAGVGKRVASRIAEDGRMIAEEAADAARDNRPIVAAGVLGLTAWIFRKPLMAFAGAFVGSAAMDEEDEAPSADAVPERSTTES